MKFKVILEKGDDGYFTAKVPFLPGCISQGKTEKEVLENIKEAVELHVSSLAEDGIPISKNQIVREVAVRL